MNDEKKTGQTGPMMLAFVDALTEVSAVHAAELKSRGIEWLDMVSDEQADNDLHHQLSDHLFEHYRNRLTDADTGLLHMGQVAWCALALLTREIAVMRHVEEVSVLNKLVEKSRGLTPDEIEALRSGRDPVMDDLVKSDHMTAVERLRQLSREMDEAPVQHKGEISDDF